MIDSGPRGGSKSRNPPHNFDLARTLTDVRVVSVLSLKGGVGKTSMTLGLAGAAQARGMRVLVIDLDPQANATVVLDPQRVEFTANDVLADGRSGVLAQAVVRSGWGPEVSLVASERALEHRAVPEGEGNVRLRVTMQGIDEYDIVLLDTPPALGELTRNALTATGFGVWQPHGQDLVLPIPFYSGNLSSTSRVIFPALPFPACRV
jgi:hypothetical protein